MSAYNHWYTARHWHIWVEKTQSNLTFSWKNKEHYSLTGKLFHVYPIWKSSIWAQALGLNNWQRLKLAATLAFQVWLVKRSTHSKLKPFAIQSSCQFKPFLFLMQRSTCICKNIEHIILAQSLTLVLLLLLPYFICFIYVNNQINYHHPIYRTVINNCAMLEF